MPQYYLLLRVTRAVKTIRRFQRSLAGQGYSVVHNGTGYAFTYYDDLAKFELPESTHKLEKKY